ncbi:hypothetical protein PU02_1337 [Bartonella ancashensis]|uniref:Uncharacterized protein n=1 Tax=Bartonella ancashensis TaxID=1318743 RepID=A0A0M3T383_9HYPH|nr:hypothetical protein PU02_1337 [Bartonella ancashensis]
MNSGAEIRNSDAGFVVTSVSCKVILILLRIIAHWIRGMQEDFLCSL